MATEKQLRLNGQIGAPMVRLIGADGQQVGVVSIVEALKSAEEAGLDLVEISPQAAPPVCRIMDFGKFRYQESKRKAAARKHQKEIHIKELKFRPGTDEGDYQVKLKQLRGFLEKGDKTKITLRFRGREMAHQELGVEMLQRLEQDLSGLGSVEQRPRLEGRLMVMVVAPKRK